MDDTVHVLLGWSRRCLAACGVLATLTAVSVRADEAAVLPGTQLLTLEGDIASQLVAGVDRFLDQQLEQSVAGRAAYWRRDASSPGAYVDSIRANRQQFAHIVGMRDPRVPPEGIYVYGTADQSAAVGRGDGYDVLAVHWPAFGDVHGEGLMLIPASRPFRGDVIAIPDASQTPEQMVGLADGVPPASQFARRLAESGFRVVVPQLINRQQRLAGLTNREYLYRSAFELGRHLIGYELQKVLGLVDVFSREAQPDGRIGVIGWGDGGLLALYAGALDTRIDAVCVSGYFNERQQIWNEPIDRNIFGLLQQFGDAELASLIAPRTLIVEAAHGPELTLPSRSTDPHSLGVPARLATPELADVRREVQRAKQLVAGLQPEPQIKLVVSEGGQGPYGCGDSLQSLARALNDTAELPAEGTPPAPTAVQLDTAARHQRQVHQLDRHSQWLLQESPQVRKQFMAKIDASSLAAYQQSIQPYREYFYEQVIGRFDIPLLPPAVRTAQVVRPREMDRL